MKVYSSSVTKIEKRTPELKPKTKVAAYARVSIDTEQLKHSLAAQVSYFSSLIQNNSDWEFAGIYVDEGITGTSIKYRKDFQRLIADCKQGKIELLLVKSISRFARDTVDTLEVTRMLKELGVDVYFEREHIHSMTEDGELMLTLLASFAQQESESIRNNVLWTIRKKFENGIPNGHKAPFGYKWNGEIFEIVPDEAVIVKEIYRRYLSGESAYSIRKDLHKRGFTFSESTVKNILFSESYTGTMILQKYFLTERKQRKTNTGELPRYAVEGMFEPLVSLEDFNKVQAIKEQRIEKMPNREYVPTPFSRKIKCGKCGCSVCRRNNKYGKVWVCNIKEKKGKSACDLRSIYEEELIEAHKQIGDFELITVFDDVISFKLIDGRERKIKRKEKRRGKENNNNTSYKEPL